MPVATQRNTKIALDATDRLPLALEIVFERFQRGPPRARPEPALDDDDRGCSLIVRMPAISDRVS